MLHSLEIQAQIIKIVMQVRKRHPGINLRDIYFMMKPQGIGRDRFEQLCKLLNLSVRSVRNKPRTTDSSGVKRFDNLLKDLVIIKINQVWQSDITYYEIEGQFYYLTFIQDTYTKVIVGHSVSKSLGTRSTTLLALKVALRRKASMNATKGLIFHSDGGGQYYSNEFLLLTHTHGIVNSMGKEAQENGMAERLNGVIKRNYLDYKVIRNFETLKKNVDRSVWLYNHEKPHKSLGRKSPIQFEMETLNCDRQTKQGMKESFNAKASVLRGIEPRKTGQTKQRNQDVFSANESVES